MGTAVSSRPCINKVGGVGCIAIILAIGPRAKPSRRQPLKSAAPQVLPAVQLYTCIYVRTTVPAVRPYVRYSCPGRPVQSWFCDLLPPSVTCSEPRCRTRAAARRSIRGVARVGPCGACTARGSGTRDMLPWYVHMCSARAKTARWDPDRQGTRSTIICTRDCV